MKIYIVYVNGSEVGYIKAASHNAAEKKAIKKYHGEAVPGQVQVVHTEI